MTNFDVLLKDDGVGDQGGDSNEVVEQGGDSNEVVEQQGLEGEDYFLNLDWNRVAEQLIATSPQIIQAVGSVLQG